MKILFVTWDGPQANYLESLFLPIFQGLAARGFAFHVLQFTWADAPRIASTRAACAAAGIGYHVVPILRRPKGLGAVMSVLRGLWVYRRCLRRDGIEVVMPRSTLPGLLVLWSTVFDRRPIVFDADGLAIDERVEFAGQRPGSWSHRWQRDIEAQLVRESAVVLTRTAQASRILQARAGAGTTMDKFHVVGNGRDVACFQPGTPEQRAQLRAQLSIDESTPLLVYAGSLGPQYCVPEMLQLFERVCMRRSDARMLVLTQSAEYFHKALAHSTIGVDAVCVMAVPHRQVPCYLAIGDLGIALRRPSFSMQGIAPIKLGEYLLCGVPVAATAGIGDANVITRDAGWLAEQMAPSELDRIAGWFVDEVLPQRDTFRERTRQIGQTFFSLDASIELYVRALARLEPQA